MGSEREIGHVHIYAPEGIEVITDEDSVVGAHPDPAPSIAAVPNARLVSAWTYSRRPVELTVRTLRKPTRLTANVSTSIHVRQELVEVVALLDYRVEHAGIDTFRFAVPEGVAERVQIRSLSEGQAPAIKQRSKDAEASDGWVGWTVVMQQDVLGTHRFEVRYDVAREAAEAGDDPPAAEPSGEFKTTLPLPRVLGLEPETFGRAIGRAIDVARVVGEAVVLKDRALSVSAEATGGDVETIDIRELKVLKNDGYHAFRYFVQPVTLELVATKHEIQEVIETVISKALIEAVVGRDPTARYRCRYAIKSSERQRLRLDLPRGAEPLAVLVDRKEVALEKNDTITPEEGWTSYFVNVSRTKSSDKAFYLTVQFLRRLEPPPFDSFGGTLEMQLPRLFGQGSAGVAVQQLRTVIWVPDDYWLVECSDNFSRDTKSRLGGSWLRPAAGRKTVDLESWIGSGTGGLIDFPTEGHAYRFSSLGSENTIQVTWWQISFYTAVLSGLLLLVGLVLGRTSWENRLGVLLIAGFAVTLYSLVDADMTLYGLVAARYGIAAMLAYWLIHTFFHSRSAAARPAAPAPTVSPVAVVIPPPGVFDKFVEKRKRSETP